MFKKRSKKVEEFDRWFKMHLVNYHMSQEQFDEIESECCITCLPVLAKLYPVFKLLKVENDFKFHILEGDDTFKAQGNNTIVFESNKPLINFDNIFKLVTRENSYYHLYNMTFEQFKTSGYLKYRDDSKDFYPYIAINFMEYNKNFVDEFEKEANSCTYLKTHYSDIKLFYDDFMTAIHEDENFFKMIASNYSQSQIMMCYSFYDIQEYRQYVDNYYKSSSQFDMNEDEFVESVEKLKQLNPNLITVDGDKAKQIMDILNIHDDSDNETKNDSDIDYKKLN